MLDILALLNKILRLTYVSFPDAMKFEKPGFDAGWQALWEEEE